MKIEISPKLNPSRGADVIVGNVYQNHRASAKYLRVVVGIVKRDGTRPWNNVVCLHVDNYGDIVGASCNPYKYVQEHQDLIGRVKAMPTLKIEWLK